MSFQVDSDAPLRDVEIARFSPENFKAAGFDEQQRVRCTFRDVLKPAGFRQAEHRLRTSRGDVGTEISAIFVMVTDDRRALQLANPLQQVL